MANRAFAAFVVGLLAQVACAQPEIYDTKWTLDDDGRLVVAPQWHVDANGRRQRGPAGDPEPFFGRLIGGYRSVSWFFQRSPIVNTASLVLTGVSDGASRTNAGRLFRKLDLGTDLFSIGWHLHKDAEDTTWRWQRRAQLDRLMALRIAARADNPIAFPFVHDLLYDPDEDVFLRRAALSICRMDAIDRTTDVASRLDHVPADDAAAITRALARSIRDVDILISVRPRRVPPLESLLAARTRAWRGYAITESLDQGGSFIGAEDLQLLLDAPTQLPYELALRLGNWSIDHALFSLRIRDSISCAVHLTGEFQPEHARAGLEEEGLSPSTGTGSITARLGSKTVSISDTTVILTGEDHAGERKLSDGDRRLAAAAANHPIFLHARGPLERLGPLGKFDRATLFVDFEPNCEVVLRVECAEKSHAEAWRGALAATATTLLERLRREERAHDLDRATIDQATRERFGFNEQMKTLLAPVTLIEALDVRIAGPDVVVTVPAAWLTPERVVRVALGLGAR